MPDNEQLDAEALGQQEAVVRNCITIYRSIEASTPHAQAETGRFLILVDCYEENGAAGRLVTVSSPSLVRRSSGSPIFGSIRKA